ncbi:hypothetical protein Vadar_021317 [Vaccinium darrowii]|uniref:Uncharacterized protein n=1 Tax=Vaccinium darrowii TaxID=229202 RepID=A0ACB7Z536_9ERIC|nr:hypothetical protein Vadar_021317 [Vaccinium darrowii]
MAKGGEATSNIPVIDMQDFPGQSGKLMEACREWGFFRIINHGISPALMGEMKAVSRSLLDLPVEIKLRNSHPVQGKGYTPPNMASPVFEGLGCYERLHLEILIIFWFNFVSLILTKDIQLLRYEKQCQERKRFYKRFCKIQHNARALQRDVNKSIIFY